MEEAARRLSLLGAGGAEEEGERQQPAAEGRVVSSTAVVEEARCSRGPLAVMEEVPRPGRRSLEGEEAEQTNGSALVAVHVGRRMLGARRACGSGFPLREASLLVLEAGAGQGSTVGTVLPEQVASFPRAAAQTYRHQPTGEEP